jgi:hypothetical protein
MARKATTKSATKARSGGTTKAGGTKSRGKSVARVSGSRSRGGGGSNQDSMGDAFIKLLQSPLVADLVAVAATAALAALAEHGFSSRGAGESRRTGRAVKEAGKAAAAAIGRRLTTEIDEIRSAAKAKRGAKA